MKLFFKKTEVPVSNEIREVESVQLWQVTWWSRNGEFSGNVEKEYEVFISEEEAKDFANSLRAAYKLLRHTSGNAVDVKKLK